MAKEVTKEQLVKAVFKVMNSIEGSRSKFMLKTGMTLKRSPIEHLEDLKIWDSRSIVEEADRIANKTSKLPRTDRDFIKMLIYRALNELSKQPETSE